MDIRERQKIAFWRKQNRVRLIDVGKYLNVTAAYISMWENGHIDWDFRLIKKYQEYIEKLERRKELLAKYEKELDL